MAKNPGCMQQPGTGDMRDGVGRGCTRIIQYDDIVHGTSTVVYNNIISPSFCVFGGKALGLGWKLGWFRE